MGLSSVVETIEGSEHPTWDPVCRRPDNVLAAIMASLPSIDARDFEGDPLPRPYDFTVWKKAAPDESEAKSRYLELTGVLQTEANYCIVRR